MEQILDVFAIDWKILIVQMVNFSVLLGVLWYLLYKPLMSLIEKRRAQIIEGVANAERAEAALRDADAKKAEVMTRAALDAEALVAAARDAAKVKEGELLAEAQVKYERMLRETELKGEEIKREALAKSKDDIAKLIVLGIERTQRIDGAERAAV